MIIQLKKGRDSRPTLACVRTDGSRTWGRLHPFFPAHDLTHYAVESVLGFSEAFFGLIASGWDIDTFAGRGRPPLPVEAMWVECIVGIFDLERGSGTLLGADEFNRALEASLAGQSLPPFRRLTPGDLAAVRTLRGTLTARWTALEPGATLEMPFPAAPAAAPAP